MTQEEQPNWDTVANRRRQRRRWIDALFSGNQAAFGASTNDGEKQINQGELSGLLKSKSFGERRARTLEKASAMPRGYLDTQDAPPGELLSPPSITTIASEAGPQNVVRLPEVTWPFKNVTYLRLMDLKRTLGPKIGQEAIRDIDALLDVAVGKWERVARTKKSARN